MNIKIEKEMTFYLIDTHTLFIIEGDMVRSFMTLTNEEDIYLEYACTKDPQQVISLRSQPNATAMEAIKFLEAILKKFKKEVMAEALLIELVIFNIEYKVFKSKDITEVIG